MGFMRTVVGAFVGSVLAVLFALAYLASKKSGKSMGASLVDVPAEAQRVFGDARTRATEVLASGQARARKKQESVVEYVRVGRAKQSDSG
jgi:hypothetical protein